MPLQCHARIRLILGEEFAFGPGKADLLDAIRLTGSISAGAKSMGMSYRKAWLLVDTMNHCFASPLVAAVKGGSGGGGAAVTACGEAVLAEFRELQKAVDGVVAGHMPRFEVLSKLGTGARAKSAKPQPRRRSRR